MSGFQNTRYGTTPNKYLVTLADDTPVKAAETGMLGTHDQPINITPVTANATNVYSRNKQPKNVTGLYQGEQFKVNGQDQYTRIVADGVKTVWTETEVPSLVNLVDVGNQAAVDGAPKSTLRNVVEANGLPLTPKGNDASLAGGDFKVVDNAGTLELHAEKTGGGAFGKGTCLDVHMDKNDTLITTTPIAANNAGVPQDGKGAHYWRADQDVVIHREFN